MMVARRAIYKISIVANKSNVPDSLAEFVYTEVGQ